MKRLIIISFLFFTIVSCRSQDCNKLPNNFTSYSQAISLVEGSTFKIHETANTSKSSWIRSAQYYSCDGNTGYFIYSTKEGKEYIHKGVPIDVWEEFKKADSKGSYYDYNIRFKYQLNLK